MKTPGSAKSASGLRGDYEGTAADYTIAQNSQRYTPEMHERWRRLYQRQIGLATRFAAPQLVRGLLEFDCSRGIPMFDRANHLLQASTRWRLVAVPGFIPDDCFFEHLSNRRFPVTNWIREEHELDYLAEPDVFHDFFGHVPMLLDPTFADFMECYGRAGAKAVAHDSLEMLARIYWYTVEFGLIDEGSGLRALGAGLASSAAELVFSVSDPDVLRLRFDPVRIMRTAYRIDSFQRCYFVLDSLDQLVGGLEALDFGPIYEHWHDSRPIPPGDEIAGDQRYFPQPLIVGASACP